MIYAVLITAGVALASLVASVLIARQLTFQLRAVSEQATASQKEIAGHLTAVQARHAEDLDRAYHCQQAETRDLMDRVMEFAEVRHMTMMSAAELRRQQRELLEDDDMPAMFSPDIPQDEDAFEVAETEYGLSLDDQEAVQTALSSAVYRWGPGAADTED